MAPENPGKFTLDTDGRLQIPKASFPPGPSEAEDEALFCVPIRWRRPAALLPGHELEAWCLWKENIGGTWVINPSDVIALSDREAVSFALRTLMYPAKYGSKGRLSCAGIFNMMLQSSGSNEFWVAPEADSVSIWTDAAFQFSYSSLGLSGAKGK